MTTAAGMTLKQLTRAVARQLIAEGLSARDALGLVAANEMFLIHQGIHGATVKVMALSLLDD